MALTIQVKTPVHDNRPVYLVGNFNDWTVEAATYKMRQWSTGSYSYTFEDIDALPSPLEYKFTKGSWDDEEVDVYGNKTVNRSITPNNGTFDNFVPKWYKNGQFHNSAYLPTVEKLSDGSDMPRLRHKRNIYALLPHDYHNNLKRRYPVLYLQDAQNLFNENAPYGNWAIDQKLAVLAELGLHEVIVIAIDHANEKRVSDYSPYNKEKNAQNTSKKIKTPKRSEGRKYIKFLVEVLKPYIDKRLRTHTGREHTGIGGSSMGGLISIYAGLIRPDIFSKLMVFSPSLWYAPKIYFKAMDLSHIEATKIYVYAGGKESKTMVPNVERLVNTIEDQADEATLSNIEICVSIDEVGEHSEKYWRDEFPKAVEWLFF